MSYLSMNALVKKSENTKFTFLADGRIEIEDPAILWPDLSGRHAEEKFKAGENSGSFNVVLSDPEIIDELAARGVQIKERYYDQDDPEAVLYYFRVLVKIDERFPINFFKLLQTENGKTLVQFDEREFSEIDNVIATNEYRDLDFCIRLSTKNNKANVYLSKNFTIAPNTASMYGGKYDGIRVVTLSSIERGE